jgi:hypothetical protein
MSKGNRNMNRHLWKGTAVVAPALTLLILASNWNALWAPNRDVDETHRADPPATPKVPRPTHAAKPATVNVAHLAEEEQPEGGFTFPDDASGKELAQKLPPGGQGQMPNLPASKKQVAKVTSVENPTVFVSPTAIPVPKLPPVGEAPASKPAPVPEPLPLIDYAELPSLPGAPKVDVLPPVSVPSVNVEQPPVLVQVKQPAVDPPVSVNPTQEASKKAALEASPPPRTETAPYLPVKLPDPFANRKDATALESPAEDVTPITGNPALPGP